MKVRKLLLTIGAFFVSVSALVLPLSTTAYAANYCDGHWLYATWGRGCVYGGYGQVQDIKTDGYCVRAKAYNYGGGYWFTLSGSVSCGAIASFAANTNGDSLSNVRMYRDDGRYLTLYYNR